MLIQNHRVLLKYPCWSKFSFPQGLADKIQKARKNEALRGRSLGGFKKTHTIAWGNWYHIYKATPSLNLVLVDVLDLLGLDA